MASPSTLPSDNDNQLVNNILQDLQDNETNPESMYHRQMDNEIHRGGGVSAPPTYDYQYNNTQAMTSYPTDPEAGTMMSSPPPLLSPPAVSKINYVRYATLFLLFVIVFVGLTHPKVYSMLSQFSMLKSGVTLSLLNIGGTLLLAAVGAIVFLLLQHFV